MDGHRCRLDGQRDTTSELGLIEPVRLEMEPARAGREVQIDGRCTAKADGRCAQRPAEHLSPGTEHPGVDDFQDPALLVAADPQPGRGLLGYRCLPNGQCRDRVNHVKGRHHVRHDPMKPGLLVLEAHDLRDGNPASELNAVPDHISVPCDSLK